MPNIDIIVLFDNSNNLWFSYNNILNSIGYNNAKMQTWRLKLDDKYFDTYENILKKASYTDGEQAGGTGHEDHEWIKNFIQEQNPQKSGIQELEKVSTDELKKLLTQLVKKEDYESAAKVRDELSKRGEVEED